MNEDTAWLRRIVRWAVNVVVVLALAWFLVYAFCAQVPVSGNSMQPVLSADDVVLVNRLVYDVGEPERLDIVVCGGRSGAGVPGRAGRYPHPAGAR